MPAVLLGVRVGIAPPRRWFLEVRTPGGGVFRIFYANRALARAALQQLRFQAHRAKDPHCTCNDCVDAHFEEEPRG